MKRKTIYISILVLLILLIASIFYFKSKTSKEIVVEPKDQIVEVKDEPKPVDDKIQPSASQLFDNSMAKANKSFSSGDYASALKYYKEALTYKKTDTVYARMYTIYLNQKDWTNALGSINQAITISPVLGDYWNWKILVLDEGFGKSFSELKTVYNEAITKVKSEEVINVVTKFARLAGNKGEKSEAISLWQKAIVLNPDSKEIYQKEIDLLNNF